MKKIAVFVEGYTELRAISKLIEEVAGRNRVVIEQRRIIGGANTPRRVIVLQASSHVVSEQFYVLIVDCGGDHQVKSRVLEEHQGLTNCGYERILAVRDVRPNFELSDIPRLRVGLTSGIKQSLIPVDFILAVMEIEAWFIAEASHFCRIDVALTPSYIASKFGFDPSASDISLRNHPAGDISKIYESVGQKYEKGGDLTVDALDAASLYLEVSPRFSDLSRLVGLLDSFLTAAD